MKSCKDVVSSRMNGRNPAGFCKFTLIELLVVIAIITILPVQNF